MLTGKLRHISARVGSLPVSARSLLTILYVTALPLALFHEFLWNIWAGGVPRAWDGTGHFGIAQIYDREIFPDTFGWTQAYFGGMPFPNFYPPLFFWLVSLLHHTGLFSLLASFKLLVMLPMLLIPAAMWALGWATTGGNRRVAFWTSLLSLWPLLDWNFGDQKTWVSGLEYSSTFGVGLYTQPLGFVLLIAWYVAYLHAHRSRWRFALTCVLLALAVLGNFLNGITTTFFIAATLATDLRRYRAASREESDEPRRALFAHLVTPLIAFGLTLFWLAPMLTEYTYFVTRPFSLIIITGKMVFWFILALYGCARWLRRPTPALGPYLITCAVLVFVVVFAAVVSPPWFPMQANRMTPSITYLLAVPVGYAVADLVGRVRSLLGRGPARLRSAGLRAEPYVRGALLGLLFLLMFALSFSFPFKRLYAPIVSSLSVYLPRAAGAPALPAPTPTPPSDYRQLPPRLKPAEAIGQLILEHKNDFIDTGRAWQNIEAVLAFGREHRDGRYLVENANLLDRRTAHFDGHALNAYLGAQGNQMVNVIYREATPNSIFMNPLVNAFSFNPDNFGFSSVLTDDLDFVEQPLANHLRRARAVGVRYLVIHTPAIKDGLAREPEIGARHDFEDWSVFELNGPAAPPAEALAYRPALVFSRFTAKGRRRNDYNFIRLAEEQFADGWFDVPLVRAPSAKLDDLVANDDLNKFGALVLDTYDCDDCVQVFTYLRYFAQDRPLILLMRDERFFEVIRENLKMFPQAVVIERQPEPEGGWLENWGPSSRYGASQVRGVWGKIRGVLEQHKVPVAPVNVSVELKERSIRLGLGAQGSQGVPLLIRTSYHPNWRRPEGGTVYAVNPMYMLVFADNDTSLVYARRWFDWLALFVSVLTLLSLCAYVALGRWRGAARRSAPLEAETPA